MREYVLASRTVCWYTFSALPMGAWRSGSAGPLQGQGRGFKSLSAHHELRREGHMPLSFFSNPVLIKSKPKALPVEASAACGADGVEYPRCIYSVGQNVGLMVKTCC